MCWHLSLRHTLQPCHRPDSSYNDRRNHKDDHTVPQDTPFCMHFHSILEDILEKKYIHKCIKIKCLMNNKWISHNTESRFEKICFSTWKTVHTCLFSKRNDSGLWGLRLILESHKVNITFQMLIWNDLNYSLQKLKAYNSFHMVISRKYHVFRQSDKKNIYSHIIINIIPWLVHVYILESLLKEVKNHINGVIVVCPQQLHGAHTWLHDAYGTEPWLATTSTKTI